MNYIDIKRIKLLSEADESVPLYQKVIKLGEESAEVAEAFESYYRAISVKNAHDIIEECCDVINVSVDIINALNKIDPEEDYIDLENIDISAHMELDNNTGAIYQDINYLHTQTGRVAQIFLRFDGAKNVSKSAYRNTDLLLVDTFRVIKAANRIIEVLVEGFDEINETFVRDMFSAKLDKWESKQKAY